MQTVLLAVGDVVDEVDGARQRAEDREGGERHEGERGEELLGEDEPGEDEEILDPLAWAHRGEDRDQRRLHASRTACATSFTSSSDSSAKQGSEMTSREARPASGQAVASRPPNMGWAGMGSG